MGELRYSQQAVDERKRRVSSAPPKSGKEIRKMSSSYKPPSEVPIRINGSEKFIDPEKFFGKAEGEAAPFINDSETVLSLINNFGTRGMQQEATLYLVEILPKFGAEEPFMEMVKTTKEILSINSGNISSSNSAVLKFLERIAHIDVECEPEGITELMKAFRSGPILESFRLFAGIGEVMFRNSAYQLVELGTGYRDSDTIEEIGRTILEINEKFGMHATVGYRTVVLEIAKSEKLSVEDKAELAKLVTEKTLSLNEDMAVFDFSQAINASLGNPDPEKRIRELCRIEY